MQTVSVSTYEDQTVLHLFWQIQYELCDWNLLVVTPNYTLYPNPFPAVVPITKNSEYNVTLEVMCNRDGTGLVKTINITLSIALSDNVIKYAPWIMCLITGIDSENIFRIHSRSTKVYLQTYLDHDITTISTTQSTQEMQSLLTSTQSITLTTGKNSITISSANTSNQEVYYTHLRGLFYLTGMLCFLLFT